MMSETPLSDFTLRYASFLHVSRDDILTWWGLQDGGGDILTSKWFGVSTVLYPLSVLVVYLLLVSHYRKKWEESKGKDKTYKLKYLLMFYNAFQVMFSLYIVKETLAVVITARYNLACQPLESTTSTNGNRMAVAWYLFHISKYLDLIDTAFMIAKGNMRQVTTLHVFHHSTMLLNSWFGVRHVPTGHAFMVPLANSFVHVCMYTYYLLSALGPWIKPYLWWKPYLTFLQISHFIVMGAHQGTGLLNGCQISHGLAWLVIFYDIILVFMFGDFYIKAYIKKGNKVESNGKAVMNGTKKVERKAKRS